MRAAKHRSRLPAGAVTQFILGGGLLISGVNIRAANSGPSDDFAQSIRPVLDERMMSLDEGGASLLHNSMILFGSSLKDGNRHHPAADPCRPRQGTLRRGRRLRAKPGTPFCNLHLALLQRMGIKLDSFGDSTGPLDGLA